MGYKFIFILAFVSFISVAVAADNPKQLTGDDLKMAMKMNDIFARHLYSSSCVDDQKNEYVPPDITQAEKAKLNAAYKKSCDCMTDIVLKTLPANDVIDYVSTTSGSVPMNVNRKLPTEDQSMRIGRVIDVGQDEKNRQKCGFKN